MSPRLTDFPLCCLTDPVHFDPRPPDGVRTLYVHHTRPPLASLQKSFDLAVARGWEARQLPYGHDLMLAAPGDTAALLDDIARAGPGGRNLADSAYTESHIACLIHGQREVAAGCVTLVI